MIRLALLLLLFTSLTSCLYRMPEEDEVRTVPNTNNPDVTHQRPAELMPQVSM